MDFWFPIEHLFKKIPERPSYKLLNSLLQFENTSQEELVQVKESYYKLELKVEARKAHVPFEVRVITEHLYDLGKWITD